MIKDYLTDPEKFDSDKTEESDNIHLKDNKLNSYTIFRNGRTT